MATFPSMVVGDTPIDSWTIQKTSGQVVALTGLVAANFSLIIHDTKYLTDRTGAGTFVIINSVAGIVQYTWAPADTSIQGTFRLWVRINDGAGHINTYGPNIQEIDTI